MKRQVNISLLAIVGEGLLSRLSFGLISFTLPLYARHLGLSLTEVGILAALNSAVAVALKPLLGWAADRFGLKRTFVAAIMRIPDDGDQHSGLMPISIPF